MNTLIFLVHTPLAKAFGGSAKSLILGALSARKASPEELAEIRGLIEEYEKGDR